MKVRKFFESLHEDLVDKLHVSIIKDHKNINGFVISYDLSGTIEWYNSEYLVYATPYWDGTMELTINIMNDNDDISFYKIDLRELKNDNDILEFKKFYYKKIGEITSGLNNRSELRGNLEIILDNGDRIKFNGYYIEGISDIKIDKISDDDVNKLLEITRKHPLVVGNKYNL